MAVDRRRRGELGERIAAAFLAVKGFEIVDRNVRVAGREIDLLARDGRVLVAVEVKLRCGARFGPAVAAVDGRKLARLRFALAAVAADRFAALEPRVDVVTLDIDPDLSRMVVEHYAGVG